MKKIKVVAAVIRRKGQDGKYQILATQRGKGEFKGGWEFPGGKIETGESDKEALIREIKEELEADIIVGDLIENIVYTYPNFHLHMNCYWCELQNSSLLLKEHQEARWLDRETIDSVDWLPADIELIQKIKLLL